jgi:transposase
VLSAERRDDDVLRQLEELRAQLAAKDAEIARKETELAQVIEERDKLRRAYEKLKEQLELLRRRIFQAKAERIDVSQLELEFAQTKAKLDEMARQLGGVEHDDEDDTGAAGNAPAGATPTGQPPKTTKQPRKRGRRNLRDEDMPEERIVIEDPALEGKAERIGFEESCRYGYRRGGPVRYVVARVKYKVPQPEPDAEGKPTFDIVTAKKPRELFERGLLAPSLIAHILVAKFRFGLPFHRLALMLRTEGVRVDDSLMCRYAEDAGNTLACIVDACAKEAKETAFCLSTDATGVCIQPEPTGDGRRQPCRKGHFFVVLADQDHVFFEYQPKHTSAAVCEMFRGFKGYLQADAHCVYDAIYRGAARASPDDKAPDEVGCWSHCRRRAWEAATAAKDPAAREALLRMHKLFELEEQWADLPPQQRHARRQRILRPLVDDFFAWAKVQFERVKGTRGLVASAFGYAVRQEQALRRFLDDGRLRMTNNHSERALRHIATGRRSWFFFGSDIHATAAANLFSLIASCLLHNVDAEAYLAAMIRVLPHWPRDRYLELAPKYWLRTRERLDPEELKLPLGRLTVPPPLAAEQQPAAN